jgi:hypothetical protein
MSFSLGNRMSQLGVGLALLTSLPKVSEGAVMLDAGTTLPGSSYITYGTNFANSMVAIKRIDSITGVISYGSGIQIDEKHVITAAHVMDLDSSGGLRPISNMSVEIGPDILSPSISSAFARYQVHPTYPVSSGLGTGSQIDIAIIEINEVLAGRGVNISSTSVATGIVLAHAGYGRYALQEQSIQPVDGKLRAFNAASRAPTSLFNDYFYTSANNLSGLSYPLKGGALNQDSGGGVYQQVNSEFFLTGLMVAQSSGTTAGVRTTHLDLTRPEIRQWLDAFRMNSTAPTPPKLSLNSQGGNVICLKSSEPLQCFGGRWIPEYSSDLLNWCEFANAFNPTQDGSYECPLYLTGDRQYFRLRWEMKLLAPPEAAPLQENILAMLPAPENQAAEIYQTMQPEMQPAPASETAASLSTLSAPESSQSLRVVETQNSIFSPQPATPNPYRPEAISGNQIFAPSPLRSNGTPLVDSTLKLPKIPTEPQESWKLQSPLRLKKGTKPVIPSTRSKKPLQKRS